MRTPFLVSVAAMGCALALSCSKSVPLESQVVAPPPSAYPRPAPTGHYEAPPVPAPVEGNPLQGLSLYVDEDSHAMNALKDARRRGDDELVRPLERIALEPQPLWLGNWNLDVYRAADEIVSRAFAKNQVPMLVLYNLFRDYGVACGPREQSDAYRGWIRDVAAAIGDRPVIVVLEPDAVPMFATLPPGEEPKRLGLLRDAVLVLRQSPGTRVYLAAGRPSWRTPEECAEFLKKAGLENAHGFSLNSQGHETTEANLEYGRALSNLTGGAHFVIDTSRNGAGPYVNEEDELSWCNAPDMKLGHPPSTETGEPLCDAFLWMSRPGESDGECRGGPPARKWWLEEALRLAQTE